MVDTLGKMVGRQDYNSYTEMEIHAELDTALEMGLELVILLRPVSVLQDLPTSPADQQFTLCS